jgi:hypothetical protein
MFQFMRILYRSQLKVSFGERQNRVLTSESVKVAGAFGKYIWSVYLDDVEAYSAPVRINRRSLLEKLVHGFCGV